MIIQKTIYNFFLKADSFAKMFNLVDFPYNSIDVCWQCYQKIVLYFEGFMPFHMAYMDDIPQSG